MNVRIKPGDFGGRTEDDLPLTVRQPRISTPALVILLGSTASVAALELMRQMLTLQPLDRRKVGLVYIDTDEPNSSVVEFRQRNKRVFQEFPLRIAVPVGISNAPRVHQEMGAEKEKSDPSEPHTFIRGKEPQYFANGAGGIRNNGHVAACFHHQSIYDTIERALTAITSVDTRQNTEWKNEVQVNIVTFLGGGTGSGILADIAVMIRDQLAKRQHEQRINLFCMLPESVRGVNPTDLAWRKSNATACLLELVAFSLAAGGVQGKNRYRKYMREKEYYITRDAIANEIFLIGQSSMDDPSGTARLVGLDIFQRITDASGVGNKEHSQQVDRRTLGETDDLNLPTMFGTSCPLEVRFPAEETAQAFARISASNLLPLLAQYQPRSVVISDGEKRSWTDEWNAVAPIDANPSNPQAIRPGLLNLEEFQEADQTRLEFIWNNKVLRLEQMVEERIREVIAQKEREEMRRIPEWPRTYRQGDPKTSLLNLRIKHLQLLQQEYTAAFDYLREQRTPRVPARPVELEAELTQPSGGMFARIRNKGRDRAYDVFSAYNGRLFAHALTTRHDMLEQSLERLLKQTQEALEAVRKWFQDTEMETHVQELEAQGFSSMAWQGRLDNPHPHQRHIFDLRTLRASDGRSFAVERVYLWATSGDKALNDGADIDFSVFVNDCVDYLGRKLEAQDANRQDNNSLEEQNAGRLADRVVDFFQNYYMEKFQDKNLFELLEKAAPPSPKGEARTRQISTLLYEHLEHMRGLMRGLVAFEAELWGQGQGNLDTSILLGMHWRNGQESMLKQALDTLGALTRWGQQPTHYFDFDPHRLQASYGQHGISLTTIRDFYMEQNSSMEAYLYYQEKWKSIGNFPQGFMPTHSSEEAQRLVQQPNVLGLQKEPSKALFKRLIRKPSNPGA